MILKSIVSLLLMFTIIISPIWTVIAFAQSEIIVGDTPSYTDISKAPAAVLFVISQRKLPKDLIHSYTSEEKRINSDTLYLVHIEYGAAQDCPAGCFYEYFVGVVSLEKSSIFELPGPNKNYALSQIYSQPPFAKRNYNFDQLLENVTNVELAKQANNYGWKIIFTKPYICSWLDMQKSTVTRTKAIHEGKKVYESFTGSVFIYIKDGSVQWDFSDLHNKIIKKENITIEEKI